MTQRGEGLWFERLEMLRLWDLQPAIETYRSARCPRLSSLQTRLDDALGLAEVTAMVDAFPELVTLETVVADRSHALVVASQLGRLGRLARWTVEYDRADPAPEDVRLLAAEVPASVEVRVRRLD